MIELELPVPSLEIPVEKEPTGEMGDLMFGEVEYDPPYLTDTGRLGGSPGSGVTWPGLSGGSEIVRLLFSTFFGKLLGGKFWLDF